MIDENDDWEFDCKDTEAIKFIMNTLPQELKEKMTEESLDYFLDLICDYYGELEKKAMLDSDDVVEIDQDEMVGYVVSHASEEMLTRFTPLDIRMIICGEMDYCEAQGMYED